MTERPAPFDGQQARSRELLARHGKSFHWASHLLQPQTRWDASTLYAFCRQVDDAVDLATSCANARQSLAEFREGMSASTPSGGIIGAFRELVARQAIPVHLARDLLDGVATDLGPVRMQDEQQLLQYCYRVAGTVGAMMCPILGVTAPRARPFAIDLGIAMQLTNIARDVLEDARQDRVYLPRTWLGHELLPAALLEGASDARQVAERGVVQLLQQAEIYYRSADQGMHYIPLRNRLAILTAARLYRAIGLKIRRAPAQVFQRRVVVGPLEKAWRTPLALLACLLRPSLLGVVTAEPHNRSLHAALQGLVLP